MAEKREPMASLAERIAVHLKRFERDPVINAPRDGNPKGLRPYYETHAYVSGNRIFARYITYQGGCSMTRDEAVRYLAKLDSGFVGRHYDALRSKD